MSLEEKITQLNQNMSVLIKVLEDNTKAVLASGASVRISGVEAFDAAPGGVGNSGDVVVVNTQFGEPEGPVNTATQQTETVPKKKRATRRTKAQKEAETEQAAKLAAQEAEIIAQSEAAQAGAAAGPDVASDDLEPWETAAGESDPPEAIRLTVTSAENPAEALKAALNAIAQKLGGDISKLGNLLKTFGTTKLNELPADKRDDMLNQANEFLPEEQRLTSL